MLSCTIANHFECFTKCSQSKYENLQHTFCKFCCSRCNINKIQISSVPLIKVELLNYILLCYSYVQSHLIRSLPIHTLFSFIFTSSQCLSCSHQKPYSKLHRFVVPFRFQLLGISNFSDCFHEVFLNYKIMISTNCKHTRFSTNISQVCSIKAI